MNRHQRRKLAVKRKDAKAVILNARAMLVLKEERAKRNLSAPRSKGSGCLGNRGIYQGQGLYPAPGFGSGAFKEKPQSERALRQWRSENRS